MNDLDDFIFIKTHVLDRCGVEITHFKKESESTDYSACSFKIHGNKIQYRRAKTTPTKTGQFVTIWKRKGNGPITPFDRSDKVELFVVTVRNKSNIGQFIFPQKTLIEQGVFSVDGKGGKRAIRVYPPWDKVQSKQAKATQAWQSEFFIKISKKGDTDLGKIKKMYLG